SFRWRRIGRTYSRARLVENTVRPCGGLAAEFAFCLEHLPERELPDCSVLGQRSKTPLQRRLERYSWGETPLGVRPSCAGSVAGNLGYHQSAFRKCHDRRGGHAKQGSAAPDAPPRIYRGMLL